MNAAPAFRTDARTRRSISNAMACPTPARSANSPMAGSQRFFYPTIRTARMRTPPPVTPQ